MNRNRTLPVAAPVCLTIILSFSTAGAEDFEPTTAWELFRRSAQAYQAVPSMEIVLTTSVEIPGSEPGERVVRYLFGKEGEAVVDIGSLMRVVATGETIYVEKAGHEDRYFAVPCESDVGSCLAAVRGRSSFAGLWEPPQAALRAGKGLAEIVDAFRYSHLLGELSVADFKRLPGPAYEVLLEADNGTCLARFDGSSFFLQDVEYRIEPPGAVEGYVMQLVGRYSTREIDYDAALFKFSTENRKFVESLRDLSPAPPGITRPPEEILSPEELSDRLLLLEDLAAALRDKRVLLVGEDHLYEEPPEYMVALLKKLDDKPISLLLEMPNDVQHEIDQYLREGSESVLDEIFTGKPVLQLQRLLRWAHQNRKLVPTVKAIDEPLQEIQLKRAFLADTRNPTMAQSIVREWKAHPDRRIVVYAGQLHIMKAGRYKVNQPNRQTAGSRLPGLGVSSDEIAVVMLNGGENFHLHAIWEKPGVLALDGEPIRIPIAYFIDYPIFGIEFADEAFDYFVNLGPLTRIEVE